MKVIECLEGRYETQGVPFGTVYKRYPGCIIVGCDCAEGLTLTPSMSICHECGADYASIAREELSVRRLGEENLHPWRYHRHDSHEAGMFF